MTTPETPASVLGGPDLLTEMAARLRHRVDECGVEMTCMFDEDGCHGCTACEQDEALLDRYDREHTRPTTARDAALREEGRVQEREATVQDLRELANNFLTEANGHDVTGRTVMARNVRRIAEVLASRANHYERGDHLKPTPDASQGSAPVAGLVSAMAKLLEAQMLDCTRCAELEGYCGGCYEAHALLEQVRALPAPPAAPQGSPLPGGKAMSAFYDRTECITLYQKPCGCAGSYHWLLKGCIDWQWGKRPGEDDLMECRECGAVWTVGEVKCGYCERGWTQDSRGVDMCCQLCEGEGFRT